MNCFLSLLFLFCDMLIYGHNYPIHEISFARRVWGLFLIEVMFLSHCGYVLRPIVIILSLGVKSKRCMCEFFRLWFIPNVVLYIVCIIL